MPLLRVFAALSLFAATALAAGCGDSAPVKGDPTPNEKQKQKEEMKPGPGGPKSK